MVFVIACDELIGACNAMGQPLFDQEVERPIDRRRGGGGVHGAYAIEQIVGFQPARFVEQQTENFTADGRKARATLFAPQCGIVEQTFGFVVVVVMKMKSHNISGTSVLAAFGA